MGTTNKTNLYLAIIWLLVFGVTLYMIFHGLSVVIEATSKIIVAILTGMFVMAGAFLSHILAQQKEREAEVLRRKQERYAAILEGLVPYIRAKGADSDAFATAVLHSYVVGDIWVAEAIHQFINERTSENLDRIIYWMRKDLGMEDLMGVAPTAGLLPAPKANELGTL